MKYTTLFLDLDNTLLDFSKAEAVSIRRVLSEHGLPFDDDAVEVYSKINRGWWERFENGEIPKEMIYEGRFISFCEHYGLTADTKTMAVKYTTYLGESNYTIDGVFEVLDYLKARGYYFCATTNGLCTTQYSRIKGSGLEPYFDGVFVSEDAGSQKPDTEYFDYVIDKIPEKDKSKMLVVGDSQSSDILGGINSGIDTCWYNPQKVKGKYMPTYEIKSLQQLKEIL